MTSADHWMTYAACRDADPNLFFPELGANYYTTHDALKICRGCPVREECLQAVINHPARGIWGGTTETQRRRRGIKIEPVLLAPSPICGTERGYWRHWRAGDPPCDDCVEGMRYAQERRRRRSAS